MKNYSIFLYLFKLFAFCLIFSCSQEQASVAQDKLNIIGVDISSIISLENSGVRFYDFDNKQSDIFKILSDNGVNFIRVRVWVDPFDSADNGYGGGNCDLDNAVKIGLRAKEYGLKLLVDFHYSDFWADPSKQQAPKAWQSYNMEQKQQAIYDYTYDSVTTLVDYGVEVSMVQIGNEINNGLCGETSWTNKAILLNSASSAIRQFGGIMIAVHFTNPEKSGMLNYCAKMLAANGVDYDVFATSYYPFWHGELEPLKKTLTSIKKIYNKEVMIAETSYPFTFDDTDGQQNTVTDSTSPLNYEVTVQGQTKAIKAILSAMQDIKALGAFYWEPAWITVGKDKNSNKLLWEQYGSGWASSFASEYDPNDAGKYFGGSSWDNQALFDSDGKVLDSIKVFKEFIK